jgi:hypothetical protein
MHNYNYSSNALVYETQHSVFIKNLVHVANMEASSISLPFYIVTSSTPTLISLHPEH